MPLSFAGAPFPPDPARLSTANTFTANQTVAGVLSTSNIIAASSIKIDQGILEAGTTLTTSLSNLVINVNGQIFRVPLL